MLEDSHELVRVTALETLGRLELATLALHADAVLARLEDSEWFVRDAALDTLRKLEPPTLARYADAVVARLEDSEWEMRHAALKTLGNLEPATLARYADAVATRLEDSDESVRDAQLVRRAAWDTLRKLPRAVTRDLHLTSKKKGADVHVAHVRSKVLGRASWYRCRLRLRVRRLALYWYALPYRPSGPGHARDVAAWDRMNETRGQTPRLQPPEQSGAEADESNSSESLAAPTWTCHRCRYLNYGAIRCALCGSPKKQPAAGPHETARARKRRR